MELSPYYHIIIAFVLGFITGVFSVLFFHKNNFETSKIISLVMIFFWVIFHTVAFFTELKVAWIFDVVGAGATGHITGLDLVEIFKKIKGK